MIEREVEVVNPLGLHARTSARLAQFASSFGCRITVVKGSREVNAKSIMGLMLLAAGRGTRLVLRCDGDDEADAAQALAALFARGFGES